MKALVWEIIDGDGDIDIAAGRRPEGSEEPLIVVWFENPGDGSGSWENYEIGTTNHSADRFAVADLNGDRKADIIITEERYPSIEPDGNIFWYQQPDDRTGEWNRNRVVTQYSINNLDVKDMDGDGVEDIIGGGRWFKYYEGKFIENIIDASYTFSRSATGQFIEGGRPEVLLVVGDGIGPLNLYEWHGQDGSKQVLGQEHS